MEINIEQLDALLQVLRDNEVEQFEGFGFRVAFAYLEQEKKEVVMESKPSPEEVMTIEKSRREKAPKSIWHDPNLWPNGQPPEFPTK